MRARAAGDGGRGAGAGYRVTGTGRWVSGLGCRVSGIGRTQWTPAAAMRGVTLSPLERVGTGARNPEDRESAFQQPARKCRGEGSFPSRSTGTHVVELRRAAGSSALPRRPSLIAAMKGVFHSEPRRGRCERGCPSPRRCAECQALIQRMANCAPRRPSPVGRGCTRRYSASAAKGVFHSELRPGNCDRGDPSPRRYAECRALIQRMANCAPRRPSPAGRGCQRHSTSAHPTPDTRRRYPVPVTCYPAPVTGYPSDAELEEEKR